MSGVTIALLLKPLFAALFISAVIWGGRLIGGLIRRYVPEGRIKRLLLR